MIREAIRKSLLACLFLLAAAGAGAQTGTRIYVSLEGNEANEGRSWENATTLASALQRNLSAGTEIWMKGYEDPALVYTVGGGLTVPAGIQLYGGFAGTEERIDDRATEDGIAYRMRYRTVLSGDVDHNDKVDGSNLIFPDNATRTDNATHVLTLNLATGSGSLNGGAATVVNGLTIARGHADGDDEAGGGIYVTANGSTQQVGYRIEQCFFIGNYATWGGALYVDDGVADNVNGSSCLVDRCGFFNNAAGSRSVLTNEGGAIYLGGAGCVVNTAIFNNENGGILIASGNTSARVLNSTVTRNTGSGIDGNGAEVVNTVIWGNATLYSAGTTSPGFRHCAYPEVVTNPEAGTDANHNIYLSDKNNDPQGPHFNSPSLRAGFDRDYDVTATLYPLWTWVPLEGSDLIDRGDNDAYLTDAYGNLDLAGNPRVVGPEATGATIDIGAFEYQPVPSSRIRYVKSGGTGDGTSWDNASGDLQAMIDDLAENNSQNLPGEVWVAAGEYEPRSYLIPSEQYSSSFRMRDGISVYGGFAGTEDTKAERPKGTSGMPWDFKNRTILKGSYYDDDNVSYGNNRWAVTGDSRHVVWFAKMPNDDEAFTRPTYLDGVTIKGGYAQGGAGLDEFMTDRGAGVYMDSRYAYLTNCIVTQNNAAGPGGGVYLKDGRIQGSLLYNNNSETNGGAVYVDGTGLVHRSMLVNNSAGNGAGAYLAYTAQGDDGHPEYLILSTCVVTNNTARQNGAVYCAGGGVLMQNIIANNWCPTTTDATDPNAAQTGGLYIDRYGLVINSVLWNNRIGGTDADYGTNVPMYARNPAVDDVRFLYNAISGVNNAVWNNIYQQQTLSLVDANAGDPDNSASIGPRFTEPTTENKGWTDGLDGTIGVQSGWMDDADGVGIDYYWKPIDGSNLWARGMELGQLPEEVVLAPEVDLGGTLFAQKPAIGAHHVEGTAIVPELDGTTLRLYVDAGSTQPENDGRSWSEAYRSLNNAISFFANLTENQTITVVENGRENSNFTFTTAETDGITDFEILVLEGDLWPRYAYVSDDPKTATVDILPIPDGKPLTLVGGYYRTGTNTAERDPLNHRSQLNGNNGGSTLADGIYHVVTVESGANVTLDGFHIINGYAAGTAVLKNGGGMLVHDGATVTVQNCIFENNTAVTGAAIYAPNPARLTLTNCVVNNNTNTTATNPVIDCPADNLTLQYVTVVNNEGAAPETIGQTSFAAGNKTSNDDTGTTDGMHNTKDLATLGAGGAANFANPTNGVGATLGFDTYLGGYSEFRPLTSSTAAAALINKSTASSSNPSHDITTLNDRDLGGVPDLGAYEADLPKAGTVIYVTQYGAGKKDGSSWDNAIAGNTIYDLGSNYNDYTNERVVEGENDVLTTDSRYAGFYNRNIPYGETSNASKLFFDYLEDGDESQRNYSYSFRKGYYIDIKNERRERYVGGLQYAVEKAAEKAAAERTTCQVWVAGGTYTDWKGFVIRDKVEVLGGFPNVGTPGAEDRHPLLSTYIAVNSKDAGLDVATYETIIQVRAEAPYEKNDDGSFKSENIPNEKMRKPVLFQPDVCLPTMSPSGREAYNHDTNLGINSIENDGPSNTYRYNLGPNENKNGTYVEYEGAVWDGFTIRYGFLTDYSANRDGGAGVRMFRGVTLQNCVVADNYINNYDERSNSACMGAGIYSDGDNNKIVNCFVLNNVNRNPNSSGGGACLMVGTSYNCVFAQNYSEKDGGGVFLENAYFYNNTVAYNTIGWGNGGGIRQWTRDDVNMGLYNTILYGNNQDALFSDNLKKGSNCYIQSVEDLTSNIRTVLGSSSRLEAQATESPFASDNPTEKNDYRLKSESWCVNHGTEDIGNATLPETDVDFTDRIKDCTVDIGAYELDNTANTQPYQSSATTAIYFVTQNGAGTSSGENPENAACAEKLQTVLNAAGEYKKDHPEYEVIVKVAGYSGFVYHANTLTDENDPQSYSYFIPYGVILKGGYNELDEAHGWSDAYPYRNALEHPTKLSAIAQLPEQDVNGYHVVTFEEKPEDWTTAEQQTIIDGVWLIEGSATSLAESGSPKTRGGGAIVPKGAHVRNCVVQDNTAFEGGGLYVLPGGQVSGTLVYDNTAKSNGGGIYASANNETAAADNRAYLFSNTIAGNTATEGGGIYLEDGAAMTVNSVIWNNTATSGKDISGVTTETFTSSLLNSLDASMNNKWFPFNNCFVERYELPGNFENSEMTGEGNTYFADAEGGDFRLKAYSPLVNHGMVQSVQKTLEEGANTYGLLLAASDMTGISRTETNTNTSLPKIDVGAFARDGAMPTELVTRLFVLQGSTSQLDLTKLPEGKTEADYIGRSFYTPFTWLEDALDYIKNMRKSNTGDARSKKFEILLAGGTYKPKYRRNPADAPQVGNSFVIPYGVEIYGGFVGTEKISSGDVQEIPLQDGTTVDVDPTREIATIIADRAYSDFNQNNIDEAWELAHQTIFDGEVSTSARAHHVLYTTKDENMPDDAGVLLDGVTVRYGQTEETLSDVSGTVGNNVDPSEGRGGGIYSNGVPYTIVRSRLIDNQAVRGGAVFMKDANLTLVSSILAGNQTVANTGSTDETLTSRGGAVYMADNTALTTLYAVNTLWVNNESAGEGGAIGTNYNTGTPEISTADPFINLMNNTFACNAAATNPVIYNHNRKSRITNTLIWGNVGNSYDDDTDIAKFDVYHSASDVNYGEKFGAENSNHNILLSTDNMSTDGPRFTRPATVAGASGNDATNLWNPVSTSLVTDAGNTKLPVGGTFPDGAELVGATGENYLEWFTNAPAYSSTYMKGKSDATSYDRYSGPMDENNQPQDKVIDIGVYEYQYVSNFSTMTAIYVDIVSSGLGSGTSWANATDDLRGAIIGAANPTREDGARTVYVRDGSYSWSRLSAGTAYPLNMDEKTTLSDGFTLKGSCTGVGEQQNYSKPSVIRNHPSANGTNQLMNISTNGKYVTIDGFTFINKDENGTGITASTNNGGDLTLTHTSFRMNKNTGVNISGNSGSVLIVNSLFADNDGTGFAGGSVAATLVNTTFANNGTDMDISGSTPAVYNSVSWNNTNLYMPKDEDHNNKVFSFTGEAAANNTDLSEGPNFVDPLNENEELRDYRIRPSLTLLNKGSNDLYAEQAMGKEYDATKTDFFSEERDLYNVSRVVDGTIDIGAYEYASPLQQIIYVKSNLSNSDDSGSSWEDATDDLQGAADLAGIYYNTRVGTDGKEKATAYVLVHNNVTESDGLRVTLPGVKVYGGMNDERPQGTLEPTAADTVSNLLNQRVGLLERSEKSQLSGVTVSAESVVDGFEVTGDVTLSGGGYLSTSVVDGAVSAPTTGSTSVGFLYNTLVLGSVSGVQAVNVTATGDINGADDSENNRANVPADNLNHYVTTDYWQYQLNEYSPDMDVAEGAEAEERVKKTWDCIDMVGHRRDIAGNLRIRNEKVDNGCFETWNVTADATVTAKDYPHGKSVVYVRAGQELILGPTGTGAQPVYGPTAPFNPGFLLLEHRAGLRGNGNSVSLTNFAVERTLNGSGTDLAAMPFTVVETEFPYDITNSTDVTVHTYDGEARSAYNYAFSSTEGEAWKKEVTNITSLSPGTGFALEAKEGTTDNVKVRFYGTSYMENSTAKEVTLKQWNFQEPWSPDKNSNRFTHKENMGWNLFGSPYLCAMNYTDMEYGRVLYGLVSAADEDKLTPGGYFPVLTYQESDGASIEGHIPAGDAVFTQTATLEDAEKFTVEQPKEVPNGEGSTTITKSGDAYETSSTLLLSLSAADGAKRSVSGRAECDRLQLNAVPTEQSLADFDLGIDGVKWMSAEGEPQIFAVRGAGRYSLLGALDEESTTTVGVTTAEGGRYAIAIADDCPAEGYETVLLHDRTTGATADLLQGAYSFAVAAGEDCSERFEVSFRAAADELLPGAGMTASVDGTGLLRVGNLPEGTTRVTLYDAEGRAVAAAGCAGRTEADFRLTAHGVYVVQADGGARVKIVW